MLGSDNGCWTAGFGNTDYEGSGGLGNNLGKLSNWFMALWLARQSSSRKNLKAWKDGNLNVAYMQVRHPNWCAAQYQNWLDFGLPLEHPKVDPATQVFIFSGFWLVEHFGLRYVLVMMALELVEEIGAQLWYVLDKDGQLSWVLTVGEICAEGLNFIPPFSQKVRFRLIWHAWSWKDREVGEFLVGKFFPSSS